MVKLRCFQHADILKRAYLCQVSDTGSPEPLVLTGQPSWMEVVVTGHNFESRLPKDHPCHACFKLADWFQRRRFLNIFPIGSYVKTMSADGGP
jgi:hypothetical protein